MKNSTKNVLERVPTVLLVIIVIALATIVYAQVAYKVTGIGGDAYKVPAGDNNIAVANDAGGCYLVSNGGSKDIFVPISNTEWPDFYNAVISFEVPLVSIAPGYAWGTKQSVCGNAGNQFPYPTASPGSQVTATCDAAHLGWYDLQSGQNGNQTPNPVGSSCRGLGVGVTYDYEVCNSLCQ